MPLLVPVIRPTHSYYRKQHQRYSTHGHQYGKPEVDGHQL